MPADTQSIQAFRNMYLGAVATRTGLPTTVTLANKQMMSKWGHFAREHITKIKLVYPNFYMSASGVETPTGAAATFKASIEYPVGVFTQALFGGATSLVTPAGVAGFVVSDWIKVNIPKGKFFWDKCHRADANGIIYNSPGTNMKSNAIHGDALNFSTTTVPDTTLSATATNLDVTNGYQPIAILGMTRKGSVLILGDSLAFGQNDTVDAAGDVGVFRFIGASRGVINASRPSDRAQWCLANSVLRRSLGQYVSDIIVQQSINDLGSGARTPAELQGDLVALGNLLRTDYPNKRLWLATSIPQTADGTNAAPGATNANRIIMNNWKRAVPDPYDGCLDIADPIEGLGATTLVRDGGRYADNAMMDTTGAGTHPTSTGYLGIGTGGFMDVASFDF